MENEEDKQTLEEFLEELDKENDSIDREARIQQLPQELRVYFRRNIEHLISRIKIIAASPDDAKHINSFLKWECFNFFRNSELEFDIDVDSSDLLNLFAGITKSTEVCPHTSWGYPVNLAPLYKKVEVYG